MPYGNIHRSDRLFLPQQALARFAAQVPTPFYLYNEEGIRKSAHTINGSFCWNSGHRQWLPLTANATPAVLRIAREEGFGVLVQSESELRFAQHCQFTGDDILLHTSAMTDTLAALAEESGCGIIFDAPCQIHKMEGRLPKRCLLRYHPERLPCASQFTANTDKYKSGMSREQILQAALHLSASGVEEIGLHCHLFANARQESCYLEAADLLFTLVAELRSRCDLRIRCCDLGGGVGIGHPLPNLPHIGAQIRTLYQAAFPNGKGPALYTELGRYALGRHGILVCRVVEVRERSRRHVILDASAPTFPYQRDFHISVVGNCRREGRLVYAIHGCTPSPHDRFCDRAVLPGIQPGALLAIHDAGAYDESVRSRLCMLPDRRSYLYTRSHQIVPADCV